MYKKILLQTDLTPSKAEILNFLYQNKEAKASDIAKRIKRSRAIVYKDIEELSEMGILEKIEKVGKITFYRAKHPSHLTKLLDLKEKQIKKDRQSLENSLPDIISSFNLLHNQPGIRYFEGVDGLQKIYDEILKDGKNIYLMRAAYDEVFKAEILPIVERFITQRLKKNMRVKALTPNDVIRVDPKKDKELLVDRIWVDKKLYNAPVEIDIFGDKVAILSFSNELIGLIIESKQIAQSIKQLFLLAQIGAKSRPS